jgi:hypothetical protein
LKAFKEKEYKINLCPDLTEWAIEFFSMPKGAIIDNFKELEVEYMGFSQIDDKEIWLFVPRDHDKARLAETIAHEVGHIIELEHPKNPDQIEENDYLHELKAEHYEDFFKTVCAISEKAEKVLAQEMP